MKAVSESNVSRRRLAKNLWAACAVGAALAVALAGCAGHQADQSASPAPPTAQVARTGNAPGGSSNQRLIVKGSIMQPQRAPISAGPQYQPH